MTMTLQELIEELERHPPEQKVGLGFANPHSYRGDYEELAFAAESDTTVGDMLSCAKGALGAAYQGYKGGGYVMGETTNVWLAGYSFTGEEIGPVLLGFMLGDLPKRVEPEVADESARFTLPPESHVHDCPLRSEATTHYTGYVTWDCPHDECEGSGSLSVSPAFSAALTGAAEICTFECLECKRMYEVRFGQEKEG